MKSVTKKFWGGCIHAPSQYQLFVAQLTREGRLFKTHKSWVVFGCLWQVSYEEK